MFIKSTLSVGAWVTIYAPSVSSKNINQMVKRVLIKGGANVQDKRTFIAPDGVIQEIADSDWEAIKDHEWVKSQIKNGFIVPMTSKPKAKFKDMAEADKSAQLTEKDYKKKGRKAPRIVKEGMDDDDSI